MSISKEKMESINKDLEKLNAKLEGLSEEELKEVAAGAKRNAVFINFGTFIDVNARVQLGSATYSDTTIAR